MGETLPVKNSIGLYLSIDAVKKSIDELRKLNADHHADIVIDIDGKNHELTLDEFISRVTGA